MVEFHKELIGGLISNIRQKKKLSQENMAELLGVSERTLRRWENGESLPTLEDAVNICNYFDISIEEFFQGQISVKKHVSRSAAKMANSISGSWPILKEESALKMYYRICIFLFTVFLVFALYHLAWYIGLSVSIGESRQYYLIVFSGCIMVSIMFRIFSILLLCNSRKH